MFRVYISKAIHDPDQGIVEEEFMLEQLYDSVLTASAAAEEYIETIGHTTVEGYDIDWMYWWFEENE
jgi:hypothetical protein